MLLHFCRAVFPPFTFISFPCFRQTPFTSTFIFVIGIFDDIRSVIFNQRSRVYSCSYDLLGEKTCKNSSRLEQLGRLALQLLSIYIPERYLKARIPTTTDELNIEEIIFCLSVTRYVNIEELIEFFYQ